MHIFLNSHSASMSTNLTLVVQYSLPTLHRIVPAPATTCSLDQMPTWLLKILGPFIISKTWHTCNWWTGHCKQVLPVETGNVFIPTHIKPLIYLERVSVNWQRVSCFMSAHPFCFQRMNLLTMHFTLTRLLYWPSDHSWFPGLFDWQWQCLLAGLGLGLESHLGPVPSSRVDSPVS